jgi:hypothetical protein
MLQHFLRAHAVARHADANAARTDVFKIIEPVGKPQIEANFLRHRFGLRSRLPGFRAQALQHDNKFIAAKARYRIRLTCTGEQAARHFHQQEIPHVVALDIVERLEVVDIDEQQRGLTRAVASGGEYLA